MESMLTVTGLAKHFTERGGLFSRATVHRAVDGIDLDLPAGETLGLVGESGCGKTTTGRMLVRLLEPNAGRIVFEGRDITHLRGSALRPIRKRMQIIFQDPYASLNPRHTVGAIVAMPLEVNAVQPPGGVKRRVQDLLEQVGLNPEHYNRYPHEFSGGQRQRVGIARALALGPRLIVADEPVSALDVSVQAQIITLLRRLQREMGLTFLFIAHDLAVVRHFCRRVAVMYRGKIVEVGEREDIYDRPQHPYTKLLLDAVPDVTGPIGRPGRTARQDRPARGEAPGEGALHDGCLFRDRCPKAQPRCATEEPALIQRGGPQRTACHFPALTLQEGGRDVVGAG